MIHEVVRDYQVVSKLGEGGMGEVWLARHRHLGHEVAIKVLAPFLRDRPDFAQRLLMEARNQVRLTHPHIVAVKDFFEEAGDFYMVTEYCRGHNLHQLLTAKGILPVRTALALVKPALSALNYAHSQGVIHRDIKPANLMVGEHGEVKVMDFGLALTAGMQRESGGAQIIGSPHYMSPEQIRDPACADHRIDGYAMGVVLYEMLTARVPFDGATVEAIWEGHLHQTPTAPRMINPRISKTLNQIILKAIHKDPEKRFAGCGEFLTFIDYLEQEEAPAGTAVKPPRPVRGVPRHALAMPASRPAPAPATPDAPPVRLPGTAASAPGPRVHPLTALGGSEASVPAPAAVAAPASGRHDVPRPTESAAPNAFLVQVGGLSRVSFGVLSLLPAYLMPLVMELMVHKDLGVPVLPDHIRALFFGGNVSLPAVTLSLCIYSFCLGVLGIVRGMALGRLTEADLPAAGLASAGLAVGMGLVVLHLVVPLLCFAAAWLGWVTVYIDGAGKFGCSASTFRVLAACWYGLLLLPLAGARWVGRVREP